MSRRFTHRMFHVTKSLRAPSLNAGKGSAKISEPLTHKDSRPEGKKLMKEARKDPELYV
jgi:hypothetical protein